MLLCRQKQREQPLKEEQNMKADQFRRMTKQDRDKYYMVCAMMDKIEAMSEFRLFEKFLDKKIEIVKGRKIPKGTTGVVFWVGMVNYSKYKNWWSWEGRIGFKDENGNTYFTSENNCEVVEKQ